MLPAIFGEKGSRISFLKFLGEDLKNGINPHELIDCRKLVPIPSKSTKYPVKIEELIAKAEGLGHTKSLNASHIHHLYGYVCTTKELENAVDLDENDLKLQIEDDVYIDLNSLSISKETKEIQKLGNDLWNFGNVDRSGHLTIDEYEMNHLQRITKRLYDLHCNRLRELYKIEKKNCRNNNSKKKIQCCQMMPHFDRLYQEIENNFWMIFNPYSILELVKAASHKITMNSGGGSSSSSSHPNANSMNSNLEFYTNENFQLSFIQDMIQEGDIIRFDQVRLSDSPHTVRDQKCKGKHFRAINVSGGTGNLARMKHLLFNDQVMSFLNQKRGYKSEMPLKFKFRMGLDYQYAVVRKDHAEYEKDIEEYKYGGAGGGGGKKEDHQTTQNNHQNNNQNIMQQQQQQTNDWNQQQQWNNNSNQGANNTNSWNQNDWSSCANPRSTNDWNQNDHHSGNWNSSSNGGDWNGDWNQNTQGQGSNANDWNQNSQGQGSNDYANNWNQNQSQDQLQGNNHWNQQQRQNQDTHTSTTQSGGKANNNESQSGGEGINNQSQDSSIPSSSTGSSTAKKIIPNPRRTNFQNQNQSNSNSNQNPYQLSILFPTSSTAAMNTKGNGATTTARKNNKSSYKCANDSESDFRNSDNYDMIKKSSYKCANDSEFESDFRASDITEQDRNSSLANAVPLDDYSYNSILSNVVPLDDYSKTTRADTDKGSNCKASIHLNSGGRGGDQTTLGGDHDVSTRGVTTGGPGLIDEKQGWNPKNMILDQSQNRQNDWNMDQSQNRQNDWNVNENQGWHPKNMILDQSQNRQNDWNTIISSTNNDHDDYGITDLLKNTRAIAMERQKEQEQWEQQEQKERPFLPSAVRQKKAGKGKNKNSYGTFKYS